jgi:hypothetical protein
MDADLTRDQFGYSAETSDNQPKLYTQQDMNNALLDQRTGTSGVSQRDMAIIQQACMATASSHSEQAGTHLGTRSLLAPRTRTNQTQTPSAGCMEKPVIQVLSIVSCNIKIRQYVAHKIRF